MTDDDEIGRATSMKSPPAQIKSRDRVRARGEVFTAPREVNAMLDLVKDETENIDSTFLEPACGDGNFLDEVLRRKLAVCAKKYGKCATDYEKFSFLACTTLYGVDIMADNVERCRERLFETWEGSFEKVGRESRSTADVSVSDGRGEHVEHEDSDGRVGVEKCRAVGADVLGGPSVGLVRTPVDTSLREARCARGICASRIPRSDFHDRVARAVRFVFEKNILLGNALSMKRVDEDQNDLEEPIVFTEWKFAMGDKLKREEFRFDVLLEKGDAKKNQPVEMLFDFGEGVSDVNSSVNWMVDPDDPEKKRMIPAPSMTYPLVEYWRIGE